MDQPWFDPWVNHAHREMSLVYDPAINEYRNQPGVETRVPNFGSAKAFGHKNPLKSEWCLGKLKVALVVMKIPCTELHTIFAMLLQFLATGQASEVYAGYFKQFMELVETATKKKNKKAVIFGHSFGGMVALEFVRNTPLAWRKKYIKHLILVAPTLSQGFMETVSNFATGTDILPVPTTTALSTRPMWRSFESALMNFPSPTVYGHKPLVITKQKNYSAYEMEDFLTAVGFGEGVEPFRRQAIPHMKYFKSPGVPMTSINGVGNKTPLQLIYWEGDFDVSPAAVYGNGDGKINLISVLAFDKEMRRQSVQNKMFKSVKIDKAQHSTIVTADFALERVVQEILEVNRV